MTIDNFDIIRSHLTFERATKFDAKTKKMKVLDDTYDRYVVQILNRAKDENGKKHGVNTANRLLWTREISSLEYFDAKKPQIIDLCEANGARAYIHPQVRSTYDCLKEMIKLGVDNLENPTIKLQHIMRSCMCAMHKSRDKKWVIDLDNDEMDGWTVKDVITLIKENLKTCGKDPDSAYKVPTKNGMHIITSPFNLEAARKKCQMMFEGTKKFPFEVSVGPGEYETRYVQKTGWLHKDGMTLLYCPDI